MDLNLSNSSQSTAAGTTLAFDATVSAPSSNAGIEYLNSDSFTTGGAATLDDTPFLTNSPFSLNPGDSTTDVLFDLAVPPGTTPGTYFGSFQILGGSSDSDLNVVASANFSYTIPGGTTSVAPEPSSFVLLGTGVLGLLETARRRRGSRLAL